MFYQPDSDRAAAITEQLVELVPAVQHLCSHELRDCDTLQQQLAAEDQFNLRAVVL